MKRTAVSIAGVSFFALALVGVAAGLNPDECAFKAAVGALAIFVIVCVAGALVGPIAPQARSETSLPAEAEGRDS